MTPPPLTKRYPPQVANWLWRAWRRLGGGRRGAAPRSSTRAAAAAAAAAATAVELEHGLDHGGGQGSKAEALVVPSAL